VRDLYNSIIIDEKIVNIYIMKEEFKVKEGNEGKFSKLH
jgi:hypothetical protein